MKLDDLKRHLPEPVRYRLKVRALQREIDEIEARFAVEMESARQNGTYNDRAEIDHHRRTEITVPEEELALLITRRLIAICQRRMIAHPQRGDAEMWERSSFDERWHLTQAGIFETVGRIRRDRKEKAEVPLLWIAAVTGLIGAGTGFVVLALG